MDTSFITLTISSLVISDPSPGDLDPSVPLVLGLTTGAAALQNPQGSGTYSILKAASSGWYHVGLGMNRGANRRWWERVTVADPEPTTSDEMAYKCDKNLGSPTPVDCTYMQWDQLGAMSSDTLTLAPGAVQFLHSNACYLAISASVALTLTWEQIRTAVANLLSIYVTGPLLGGTTQGGGRAHYQQPRTLSRRSIPGMDGRRRRNSNGPRPISPWKALPLHANVTLFQQTENWAGPGGGLDTCTWKAVEEGSPVMRCVYA